MSVLTKVRRAATLGLASAAVVAGSLAAATPASATVSSSTGVAPTASTGTAAASDRDGSCNYGDFCLYYSSAHDGYGSVWDTTRNDSNLYNNYFQGSGAGQYERVYNNAHSYWNRSSSYVYVCRDSGYSRCNYVAPGKYGNFSGSYVNNVESVYFYGH